MSIEILIAVTDGCRRITEYKHHPGLPYSAVFERGNSTSLRETDEFNNLIGELGDLYAEKLSSGKKYRLSLDRRIGDGDSWRFPVALNHIFQDTEYAKRAEKMPEELVVWSTGSLEHDLRIDASKPYEVELKLSNSQELLTTFIDEEKKVLVLIPEHEAAVLQSDVVKALEDIGVEFFVVRTVLDALDIISTKMNMQGTFETGKHSVLDANQIADPQRKPKGKVVPVLMIFALLAGGGALYATVNCDMLGICDSPQAPLQEPDDPQPKPDEVVKPLPGFQMKRLESGDDASCIKLVTQSEAAIKKLVTADDQDVYEVVLKPAVCGLQLINAGSEANLMIDLPDALVSQTMSSKNDREPTSLGPDDKLNLIFKKNKPQVGEYVVSVSGTGNKMIKIRFVGG